MQKLLLALSFIITISFNTIANDSTIIHVKKTKDFELDGKGSAVQWAATSFISIPKRNQGGVNYETKMKILYSENGIYCFYTCKDNKITSTIREDFSDIYNEDVVEAFFWTNEKSVIYFEYELSPHNYELPILVPNYSGKFFGWLPWHYTGERRTKHLATIQKEGDQVVGWSAEFFIPYKLLEPMQNMPPQKGTKWRANFYRIDYDKGPTQWSWQATTGNFHEYERFGTLVFDE